jgi:hypothetical protein
MHHELFPPSKAVRNEIDSLTRKFWWSNSGESCGIPCLAWDKVCMGKKKGGLGFRSIPQFNVALLAKQG